MTRQQQSGGRDSRVRLYRDKRNGRCMGVCAGLADYLGVSVKGLRIATIFGLIFFGPQTLIGYFVLGFVLKDKPQDLYEEPQQEAFWREVRTNPSRTAKDLRHKFREIERRLRAAEAHVTSTEFNLNREIDKL